MYFCYKSNNISGYNNIQSILTTVNYKCTINGIELLNVVSKIFFYNVGGSYN